MISNDYEYNSNSTLERAGTVDWIELPVCSSCYHLRRRLRREIEENQDLDSKREKLQATIDMLLERLEESNEELDILRFHLRTVLIDA